MNPALGSAPTCRFTPGPRTAAALAGLLAVASCGDDLICGRDTVEVEGRCVPVSECLVTCQPGTVFDETIIGCVPELPPRLCDDATTVEEQNSDGVFVCSGAAGSACDLPVACPEPSSLERAVACGRLFDVESRRPAIADDDGDACDPGDPASGGPCALRLRLFAADALAASPTDAPAIDASIALDSCGRFIVEYTPPASGDPGGDLAFEVDDGDSYDDQARTATAIAAISPGNRREGLRVFATRSDTDARWTADSEAATRFEESGASLALLGESDGTLAAGIAQAAALYFDEPGQRVARIDLALDETGANGAALAADTPALPTRGGQDCLDEALPFAPGLIWVAEATVTCP